MILLLGASGYIGEAFVRELQHRKIEFIPLSRKRVDYTRFDLLLEFLRAKKPAFVVNAADRSDVFGLPAGGRHRFR